MREGRRPCEWRVIGSRGIETNHSVSMCPPHLVRSPWPQHQHHAHASLDYLPTCQQYESPRDGVQLHATAMVVAARSRRMHSLKYHRPIRTPKADADICGVRNLSGCSEIAKMVSLPPLPPAHSSLHPPIGPWCHQIRAQPRRRRLAKVVEKVSRRINTMTRSIKAPDEALRTRLSPRAARTVPRSK